MPSMEDTGLGVVSDEVVVSAVRAVTLPIRTTYRKYSLRDRYIIGKYANETGSTAAVRKFRSKFPNLNESSAREFRKKYLDELKSASKNNRSPQKSILPLPRGRPLLLGVKIDEGVRKFLSALRYHGGRTTFSVVVAVAKALVQKSDDNGLKILQFGKNWAQSLFRRMGFKKELPLTGKVIIPEGARKEAALMYLHDIVTKIETHNIPPQLGFNMGQTPSKYIQRSRYTMEKIGKKSVAIVGSCDKRAITATFIIQKKIQKRIQKKKLTVDNVKF